jgi:hypothetical protein
MSLDPLLMAVSVRYTKSEQETGVTRHGPYTQVRRAGACKNVCHRRRLNEPTHRPTHQQYARPDLWPPGFTFAGCAIS